MLKRNRFVSGMEIVGTCTRTPLYYKRDVQTQGSISKCPLYLITVCCLINASWFNDMCPGKYEVIWRIKQENARYPRPVPNAEIFYTKGDNDSWGEEVSLGKIYKFNPKKVNQLVEVSTGCIVMEKCGRIHSKFKSLFPYWQGGMWFDCVQLKPLPF